MEEGQCSTKTKFTITRADVAEFMLKALQTDEFDRKGVALGGL